MAAFICSTMENGRTDSDFTYKAMQKVFNFELLLVQALSLGKKIEIFSRMLVNHGKVLLLIVFYM